MINTLLLLNSLGRVDRRFFLICGLVIAAIVAIYFLIPVFRKGQYKIQRDNLREREKAFNAAKQARDAESVENAPVEAEEVQNIEAEEVQNDVETELPKQSENQIDDE